MKVEIENYGNYSSNNYGAHCLKVRIGCLTLWFSYNTVVAFRAPGCLIEVSENCWNTTTGKHLNAIDGGAKKDRLPRAQFEKELEQVLKQYNLEV